jgi:hypothetical protein
MALRDRREKDEPVHEVRLASRKEADCNRAPRMSNNVHALDRMAPGDKSYAGLDLTSGIVGATKGRVPLRRIGHRRIWIGKVESVKVQRPPVESGVAEFIPQERPSKRWAIESADGNVAPCT